MRYIVLKDHDIFYTDWFSAENNYVDGMTVIDLLQNLVTYDGKMWHRIEYGHL